ncbi:uncharacterized protein Z519_03584 [Cladophialophora bantiana CBS 173.52]|uniref:Rab-GAP TBC domain-containing protein n=1 Tax=Cladophialophora bantiana (strain ATCC 10958 / CBS 173.52 / CDC B-1940 / NIH 8579) TaxID=1442370 RepID=A0A0D2I054_CLAB1|nr:uncharacterized protein Z519_03584 [Cladophialophora bantiana CBS 173.52]KIW96515.1 hypothetical protein Z519_03584 [Cladophialophora bantiana CBS 173.52]
MRTFADIQSRWTSLFSTSIGVDLRQAVRDGEGFDPCEEGLRSVSWKAFLLYGPLSQGSWSRKLAESRSVYVSLRDHFLRFIEHPNDLHSSADPLADDENSPWASLRQDEISREEIFQDVRRCMQDNYFFREPATQKRLLDILFIYAKLNPDIGYRQGMHELLAPIVWVVQQDAVDLTSVSEADKKAEGVDFMTEVLDGKFVEHDSFNLFCALMQTAKAFYEVGENYDSSSIVARSKRIHDDFLNAIDPELALHLHVLGILPQIYSIRWIRLLFGREFEFKDVLRIWDVLFAENLRSDIVDFTCVAMLLRSRWSLIGSDYTAAITALTHYTLPSSAEDPRSLVRDAVFLDKNRDREAGAIVIQRYSGRRPKRTEAPSSRSPSTIRATRTPQHRQSPNASPGRFASPQRQLEGLFREVTGNLHRRTEGWDVSKAVRSAVGEVRRNMNHYQSSNARHSSLEAPQLVVPERTGPEAEAEVLSQNLTQKVELLQERNVVLAQMLDDALESLRALKLTTPEAAGEEEQNLNICLAKIQFVSVYLSNPDIPIPKEQASLDSNKRTKTTNPTVKDSRKEVRGGHVSENEGDKEPESRTPESAKNATDGNGGGVAAKVLPRPSLMDSSFSFMLGENRHRSSFVSSVADLPERKRESESRTGPKKAVETKIQQERRDSGSEDDGFSLTKIRGGQG